MRLQFSKVLPLISSAILFLCLFWATSGECYDSTVVATVVGGAFTFALTTNVFYMRNSQAEKVANIKANTYKIVSQERLNYNKEMMMFMKENGFTEDEVQRIEDNSPFASYEMEALDSLNNSVNEAMADATTPVEIQNV